MAGGRVDTRSATCSLEFAGVVSKAHSGSNFRQGDKVVVMAPSYFATLESVPDWCCCKLAEHETFKVHPHDNLSMIVSLN